MRPTRSFGTYDPAEWLTEGRGLYISARTLRAQWAQLRRNFRKKCRLRPEIEPDRLLLTKLTGIPRASMLLLAYSAEMYLKSGLVKNLTKCSPGLINREIRLLGHQLDKISFEINLSMNAKELDYIRVLANLLVDGRYPLEPSTKDGWESNNEYIDKINLRTSRTWSKNQFAELCGMVQKIRHHVEKIDSDRTNPSSVRHVSLENNGYITLRHGGNLRPRVTFRGSDDRSTEPTADEIRAIAMDLWPVEAKYYLPMCSIFLDGKKKTLLLHKAS